MIRLLAAFTALIISGAALEAQRGVSIEIALPEAIYLGRDAPRVRALNMLTARDDESRIRNGFPARLRYRAELWQTGGMSGNALSRAEWDVIVDYEPLERIFRIVRYNLQEGFQSLGSHGSFDDVRSVLARSYQPLMRAPLDTGSFFYTATVDIERMTANDLAEMRSWLGTTVQSDQNIGTAVVRFVGSLFTRVLGAQKRSYQGRSSTFTIAA